MSLRTSIAVLGAFASSVLAHGTVTGFRTDGVYHGGYKHDYYYAKQNKQAVPDIAGWSAENLDNGFVAPDAYGTSDINCHKKAAPGKASASVKAGGKVDFLWSAWPESHKGPVFTYVAKCAGECSGADVSTLKWVKIDEAGIDAATQQWAAQDLIKNNNTWTTTVPETLAPGNYVFRHEIIAMHGAGSENGAQNYPQCINIEITGSGTDNPEGVLGTALYKSTDPGIVFNPYTTIKDYKMPGPALYKGGSSGGSPPPASTPTQGAESPIEQTPVPTPTSPATSVTPVTPVGTPTTPIEAETAVPTYPAESTPAPTQPATSEPEPETPETPEPETPKPETPEAGSTLPKTFTLDTFIQWLRKTAGGSKTRRHARDLY